MSDIQVTKTCNPTPNRNWDYQATLGDPDLGCKLGMGATPEEAIADLREQLEDKFMDGHHCTSDCRREGCEVVQGWQRRAEVL